MKFHLVIALCLAVSIGKAVGAEESTAARKPGMVSRLFHVFQKPQGRGKNTRQLVLTMTVTPQPVSVSEVRQMNVMLRLVNKGKKLVQLEFPTTQRIEVLVKAKGGKLVEQWSEDQSFTNEPTLVTINPGERLEYSVSVSTRDLIAGEPFTIEGFFPNFEELRSSTTILPQK
jgi:hypothetical protein